MQFVIALMIFITGIYLTIRLKGRPFLSLFSLHKSDGGSGALSPYAALSSALCGTLGVGSIIAVVSAVQQGGAGVLKYLWLGAFTGCAIKYAEIIITMRHRDGALSGAMVALREKSPFLGGVYALLCLPVALLGMGNLSQVQVLSQTLNRVGNLPHIVVAVGVTVALIALLAGGIARIGRAASIALPVMGGLYIACCIGTLVRFSDALPGAFAAIMSTDGPPQAALFTLGVARGLFISEAGMGTAAFAHSQSSAQPHKQAALGVCEVLFSTFLCTLTALCVLVTGVPLLGSAVDIALSAFSAAMGPAGGLLLCVMLTFFALSTLPVWWFYGLECVQYLWRAAWPTRVYTLLFVAIAFVGCLVPLTFIWTFADMLNLLLAIPCLMMIFLYRKDL